MPTREHTSARPSAAALLRTRQSCHHWHGFCHNERGDLTPHGRRFGVGRVISPAHCCGSLVHSTIGIAGAARVNAPETGRSSHNWLVGNRASALFTPHRAASTGSTRNLDRGARPTPRARLTSRARFEARCDQAAANPVAFHSAPGETAGASHSGDCRRGRQRLSHCGVRGLASPASVRPGDLRGVAGALSNTDGDPRAKRVNRPAGSFDRARDTLLFPRMAGVVVTFYSEANQ